METEGRLLPDAIWMNRLGRNMENLNVLRPTDGWIIAKLILQQLSIFKDIKGLEFIGREAESLLEEYGKSYVDDKANIGEVNVRMFALRVYYWWGKLEEVCKSWVVCQPQTHMDASKLRSGARAFLETEEWQILQPLEQHGLNEAAACLLFNNFTSAEFMALRTVESLLRRWYEKKTGKKIENATWGQVIRRLDEEFPEQKRPNEISYLYFLKARRDAVAHPEVVSSENDAMLTFLQVVQACEVLRPYLS